MTSGAAVLASEPGPPARRSGSLASRHPLPVAALVCTALLFLLRFGYEYGVGDQDEIIPFLLHRLDPSLLARDWFVDHQTCTFSVRLYTVLLLQAVAYVMPVWAAALLLHAASFVLICWGLYLLAIELTGDRLAAALSLPATLVFTSHWTLGGNELFTAQLTPTALASAAVLFGVLVLLRGRPALSGILFGIASCFQLLVGFHAALLAGAWLLTRIIPAHQRKAAFSDVLWFGAAFALAAAPALLPVLLQQRGAGVQVDPSLPSFFYILGAFRAPHHYLFHSFPPATYLKFAVLAAGGTATLLHLHRRGQLRHASFMATILVLSAGLMFFAYVFTEAVPVYFVLKLQLFKLTVFLKVFFVLALCAVFASMVPVAWRATAERLLANSRLMITASVLACLIVAGLVLSAEPVERRVAGWTTVPSELGQIEHWAREHTPKDALFVVPPSVTSFRSRAQRAVVVDFKALPLVDRDMQAWMRRLLDVSPIDLPERGGAPILPVLDAAVTTLSPESWDLLLSAYEIDYVVSREPLASPSQAMHVVYRAGSWSVYRVVR